jgi:hypothetical protein
VTATGRITGLDGKSYRSSPLTTAERARAIRMAHIICHEYGRSIRATRQIMAGYGVFRSTGAIAADLANYSCPRCDDE